MNKNFPFCRYLGSILVLGWSLPLFAQSGGKDPAKEKSEEEMDAFELSPFQVSTSGDDRYVATNSTSATQVNVLIKDLPFNIEVNTSQLLEDMGANDFKESLAYNSGIFTETYIDNSGANPASRDRSPSSQAGVGDPRNNAIMIRGFPAPFQQRMGFRVGNYIGIKGGSSGQGGSGRGGITLGSLIDSVNVDRTEIVRGPGALLYGLGVLSGIVNVMPKQPLESQRAKISMAFGSDDYYRGTFDATGPIIEREGVLSYRVLGALQQNRDWTDYYQEERNYGALQLKWRPTESITIFGEASTGMVRYEGYQGGKNGQAHFLRDNPNGADLAWKAPSGRLFVNDFGENYRWGAEDFSGPYPEVWDSSVWPDADGLSPLEGPFNEPGDSIWGPDNWYERNEKSGLLTLIWDVNEHLSFNVGGFVTHQDAEEFAVSAGVITDSFNFFRLDPAYYEGETPDQLIPPEMVFSIVNPLAATPTGGEGPVTEGYDPVIRRLVGYYWVRTPTSGMSQQLRVAGVYNFEWGQTKHSFILGRQEIRDTADVAVGSPSQAELILEKEWVRSPKFPGSFLSTATPETTIRDFPGAFQFKSFYDWNEPFRYEGTPEVPGGLDYYSATAWYSGTYAIYSGKFFNDRLNVIGGWRNDRYQAHEERWDRGIERGFERLGTEESYYNFPEAIKVDTFSFGLNYAATDNISVYAVTAGGVIPNTGQRDGNGDAIEPEETRSYEAGIKFDFSRMLSGTVSVFQIDRKNAIWDYARAPNPGYWEGGKNPFQDNNPPDPGGAIIERGVPINYGFNYHLYFKNLVEQDGPEGEKWREKLGIQRIPVGKNFVYRVPNNPSPSQTELYDASQTPNPGVVVKITRPNLATPLEDLGPNDLSYVFITYDALTNDPELRAIAMQAIEDYRAGDFPDGVNPLSGGNDGGGPWNVNASAASGALVTFEEKAVGYDAQLIFSPLDGLQIIANYSHVEREATSNFNLVQPVDNRHPEYGSLATEFDTWVVDFGADAFEDPKDPTTLKAGIVGKSLYYGAEDSANLWARYTFQEGLMDGFGLGFGVRYNGPQQTHIPIGANGSSVNRYPTPATEEFVLFNGALYYETDLGGYGLRLALNLYNLTDKRRLYTEATYEGQTVDVERRRTEVYLEPFSWRFTCSLEF